MILARSQKGIRMIFARQFNSIELLMLKVFMGSYIPKIMFLNPIYQCFFLKKIAWKISSFFRWLNTGEQVSITKQFFIPFFFLFSFLLMIIISFSVFLFLFFILPFEFNVMIVTTMIQAKQSKRNIMMIIPIEGVTTE